jgi:hypothetical protein
MSACSTHNPDRGRELPSIAPVWLHASRSPGLLAAPAPHLYAVMLPPRPRRCRVHHMHVARWTRRLVAAPRLGGRALALFVLPLRMLSIGRVLHPRCCRSRFIVAEQGPRRWQAACRAAFVHGIAAGAQGLVGMGGAVWQCWGCTALRRGVPGGALTAPTRAPAFCTPWEASQGSSTRPPCALWRSPPSSCLDQTRPPERSWHAKIVPCAVFWIEFTCAGRKQPRSLKPDLNFGVGRGRYV